MKYEIADTDTIEGVVQHMNEDHADACLAIVQALSENKESVQATMLWMDSTGVDFSSAASCGRTENIRVAFLKPITRDSQIRGHLVALTKHARALLER